MKKTSIVIYHNPNCGTSRNVLAMIRQSGQEPRIIEYLKTPPSRRTMITLLRSMKMKAHELLRPNEALYEELGLANSKLSEDQVIELMLNNPALINRPIVITAKGTRLCRPSEVVLEILPYPLTRSFTKEDGSVVKVKTKSIRRQIHGKRLRKN